MQIAKLPIVGTAALTFDLMNFIHGATAKRKLHTFAYLAQLLYGYPLRGARENFKYLVRNPSPLVVIAKLRSLPTTTRAHGTSTANCLQ
jgi:hypothetical protein